MRVPRPTRLIAFFGVLAVILAALVAPSGAATTSSTFSLVLDPAAVEVTTGDIAEVDVRVVRGRSFTGSVRLSVSGLPSGVTVRPGANPIRNLTTLRVATANVNVGTYNVTVTGVSGTRRASARFVLQILPRLVAAPQASVPPPTVAPPTVAPPATVAPTAVPNTTPTTTTTTIAGSDFALVVEPASVAVRPGETSKATLRVLRTGTFTEPVLISAEEIPAGVDIQLDQNPITGASATLFVTLTRSIAPNASFVLRSRSRTVRVTLSTSEELSVSAPTTLQAAPGASATGTITVTRPAGTTSPVQLTIGGLPNGASGQFSPASLISGTSVLTVSVAAGTAVGSYPLTITASTGSTIRTATTTLIVGTSGGGLIVTASPSALQAAPGQSVSATLSVTPPPGAGVGLGWGATGAPSGVAVSIATGPTTASAASATVTFAIAAGVPTGTYPITLTAGTPTQTGSTVINLRVDPASPATTTTTVAALDFTLQPSPSALTIGRGATGVVTVLLSTQGTVGAVSFATSGLPVGVSTSYTANPSTTGTTLTLNVAATVTPGVYGFTILGVAGGIQRTAVVTLTVS